jgi:hypothetical protein
METAGVIVLSIFGFYAVRLLSTYRKGMLEKGWRTVTEGAIILTLGQIPFLASRIGPPAITSVLDDTGTLIRFMELSFSL